MYATEAREVIAQPNQGSQAGRFRDDSRSIVCGLNFWLMKPTIIPAATKIVATIFTPSTHVISIT